MIKIHLWIIWCIVNHIMVLYSHHKCIHFFLVSLCVSNLIVHLHPESWNCHGDSRWAVGSLSVMMTTGWRRQGCRAPPSPLPLLLLRTSRRRVSAGGGPSINHWPLIGLMMGRSAQCPAPPYPQPGPPTPPPPPTTTSRGLCPPQLYTRPAVYGDPGYPVVKGPHAAGSRHPVGHEPKRLLLGSSYIVFFFFAGCVIFIKCVIFIQKLVESE